MRASRRRLPGTTGCTGWNWSHSQTLSRFPPAACRLPPNVLVVPAFHGELLGNPAALQMVRGFLNHRPVRASAGMRATAEIVAAAASAWRIPQATTPSPPCPR